MADQRCPNCGRDLPGGLGQHSLALVSGLVTCPHCGAEVKLERGDSASPREEPPDGAGDKPSSPGIEAPRPFGRTKQSDRGESFSGHESIPGVMKEIARKRRDGRP
jgi:uncharacterized Zn finger protein (UPF0148 family)